MSNPVYMLVYRNSGILRAILDGVRFLATGHKSAYVIDKSGAKRSATTRNRTWNLRIRNPLTVIEESAPVYMAGVYNLAPILVAA